MLVVRLNRSYGYAFASTPAPGTTSPAPALARLMRCSGYQLWLTIWAAWSSGTGLEKK